MIGPVSLNAIGCLKSNTRHTLNVMKLLMWNNLRAKQDVQGIKDARSIEQHIVSFTAVWRHWLPPIKMFQSDSQTYDTAQMFFKFSNIILWRGGGQWRATKIKPSHQLILRIVQLTQEAERLGNQNYAAAVLKHQKQRLCPSVKQLRDSNPGRGQKVEFEALRSLDCCLIDQRKECWSRCHAAEKSWHVEPNQLQTNMDIF